MENILLIATMLTLFAFGYFVVDRLGKFMDDTLRGYQEPEKPGRRFFAAKSRGKNTEK